MATAGIVNCFATGWIGAPPEQVYARVFDAGRFPELFRGYGPVPGISFIVSEGQGARRRVVLRDGHEVLERFEVTEPDRRLVYEASNFAAPLRWWCESARGEWTFEHRGDGTEVSWLYQFKVGNPFAAWAVRAVVAPFFQLAMADCIRQLTIACEAVRHQ